MTFGFFPFLGMKYLSFLSTYPEWIFIKVRGFTFYHFNRHNPQRPDINFWTISFSSHHLRCHPIGSSHHSASFTLLRGDLGTEPKISCREEKSVKISSIYFSFTRGHFQIWPYFPLVRLWTSTTAWLISFCYLTSQLVQISNRSEITDWCDVIFTRPQSGSLPTLFPLTYGIFSFSN